MRETAESERRAGVRGAGDLGGKHMGAGRGRAPNLPPPAGGLSFSLSLSLPPLSLPDPPFLPTSLPGGRHLTLLRHQPADSALLARIPLATCPRQSAMIDSIESSYSSGSWGSSPMGPAASIDWMSPSAERPARF